MEVREIIADIARAKNDLAGLALDGVTPKRIARCKSAVDDLETGVVELLTERWVPRTAPELTAAIYCVRENIRRVDSDIDDSIDAVIERDQPDEFFRVWMAVAFGRLLEFQLDVLMAALADATPTKWLN